jgi:hypothetical protein
VVAVALFAEHHNSKARGLVAVHEVWVWWCVGKVCVAQGTSSPWLRQVRLLDTPVVWCLALPWLWHVIIAFMRL